jgi:hypothetical protein
MSGVRGGVLVVVEVEMAGEGRGEGKGGTAGVCVCKALDVIVALAPFASTHSSSGFMTARIPPLSKQYCVYLSLQLKMTLTTESKSRRR